MGVDKHSLWFDGETFLQRVARRVCQVADPVVCVGALESQSLKQAIESCGASFVTDQRPNMGPLEGIRCGLAALADRVEFAFVTSCDVPLLRPQLIRFLASQLFDSQQNRSNKYDSIVPVREDRVFGMTAIYRTCLHSQVQLPDEKSKRKVSNMVGLGKTLKIPTESLRVVDPQLDSLMNVNTRNQYEELLSRFGLKCPPAL